MNQILKGRSEARIQQLVGHKIRELRKSEHISSTRLSDLVSISQGQLSKIENGKITISIKTLSKLCQVFNRPLSYLFQEEDEQPHVLGTLNISNGPEKEGFTYFAEKVKQDTDSRISLVVLEAQQVGVASSQAESLQKGMIDLFIEDIDHLKRFVPETNIFSLPYAFSGIDHQLRFLNGDFFKLNIRIPLKRRGIRFINPSWNWFRGAKRVLVSKRPILSPKDVKGLKVRIFDSDILQRFWQDLGATPVFVPWADVNDALNDDQVDVLPTHHALVYSLGFCKKAKYVTHIGEFPSILGVAMNESKYQMLSPDHQAAIKKACQKAGQKFSDYVRDMEEKNEQLTMENFNAIHINTGGDPWKEKLGHTTDQLIKEGILSGDVWQEVERTRAR